MADRSELARLYESGLSHGEIADLFGVGRTAILKRMKRLGIPSRPRGGTQNRPFGSIWEAGRLWPRISVGHESGCWLWTGRKDFGYGVVMMKGVPAKVHRVIYELKVGPIAEGMTLDHLCHTRDFSCAGGVQCLHRGCCNPAHLEQVTFSENASRGQTHTRLYKTLGE
jgi:hypothetical protein